MKKGFTLPELIGVIIILSLICLIAFPPILSAIRGSKNELSEASKKIIYDATDLYITDNVDKYPKNNGNIYCVSLESLVKGEYLPQKVYDSSTATEVSLDSLVEVKVEQGNYSYNLNNNCKNLFQYGSLIDLLLQQYNPNNVTGLVKDSEHENIYYFTGNNLEVSNNFLWYGGHQWRVLDFDTKERTLTLITQQPLTAIQPTSVVWDTKEEYESSYINSWLNEYFWNSLDSSIQNNILDSTFNVGIYTDVDEITTTQKVGLLDEEQYKRAGNTNSFLDIKDTFWLGNRYDSSNVRDVNYNGNLSSNSVSESIGGVRAVIKISDITITGGDGTLASNYQVENKATNTSEVQVGEYINVPYSGSDNACGSDNMCTFRVVSKDNDSIKVVLNGLLPTISEWADSASDNITISDLIYTNVLDGFIENIDSKYITTGTYGVGMYEKGNSYTVPQSTTITASIGLPTVGEMFSGNDIDMAYPIDGVKTFVDVNTIENPTASSYYWTMNRHSRALVRNVNYNGYLMGYFSPAETFGVRAVIYLKSGTSAITFSSGEGTPNSPYILQ